MALLLCLTGILCGQEMGQRKAPVELKKAGTHQKPFLRFYDTPTPLPRGKPGELIRSAPFLQYVLPPGIEAIRILYYSRSGNGELVAASAVVLYPDGKPPKGGWPVIGWAHRLSGVARACAPSLARNQLPGPFLGMYLNLGYAVVATDYTGLGTNFRNAGADVRSNAMDVIYSIAAAHSAAPGLGSRWIAMGAEEGAIAVVGVSELMHREPDPNYLGGIAISRLTDPEDMLQPTGNQSHEAPLLLAYGIKTVFPQFEPKDILTDRALALYEKVEQECGIPEADKVSIAAMLKPHWERNKFVQQYFDRNRLAMEPASGPLLIIDGEGDPLITATAKVVARLCKQGDGVLFNRYQDYDIGRVIGDSVQDQMAWVQQRFAGRPPRANCSARP